MNSQRRSVLTWSLAIVVALSYLSCWFFENQFSRSTAINREIQSENKNFHRLSTSIVVGIDPMDEVVLKLPISVRAQYAIQYAESDICNIGEIHWAVLSNAVTNISLPLRLRRHAMEMLDTKYDLEKRASNMGMGSFIFFAEGIAEGAS